MTLLSTDPSNPTKINIHSLTFANEFGGTLNVSRTLFKNNTSTGFLTGVGGAIASDSGPTENGEGTPIAVMYVCSSTFEGNSATASVNDPSFNEEFAAFSGFAFGGAISSLSTDATILNSRFMDNSVQGGAGAVRGGKYEHVGHSRPLVLVVNLSRMLGWYLCALWQPPDRSDVHSRTDPLPIFRPPRRLVEKLNAPKTQNNRGQCQSG